MVVDAQGSLVARYLWIRGAAAARGRLPALHRRPVATPAYTPGRARRPPEQPQRGWRPPARTHLAPCYLPPRKTSALLRFTWTLTDTAGTAWIVSPRPLNSGSVPTTLSRVHINLAHRGHSGASDICATPARGVLAPEFRLFIALCHW